MIPHVAWTPHALTQLKDLDLTAAGITHVQNDTNNWVHANCAHWALNTQHTNHDRTSGKTVTARVVKIDGQNMSVNILSIQ